MEQKQLDELDESYFGEEFIDEENEEMKKSETTKKSKVSKTAKNTKTTDSKEVKEAEIKEEVKIMPVKEAPPVEKEEIKEPEQKTVDFSEQTEEKKEEVKPHIPTDPWAEDEDDSGIFKEASTWKAITGIVVILLIFSVFTQGFQFSETPASATAGKNAISISEAESKVLDYVNTNLLQPPFVATAESSSDSGTLYKVILEVAGQQVDSYITKDGVLFFPQGFDTTVALPLPTEIEASPPTEVIPEEVIEEVEEVELVPPETVEELPVEVVEVPEELEEATEPAEEVIAEPVEEETTATGATKTATLTSKKWSFTPDKLTVKKGELVKLTITPNNGNAAFSLPEYTFSIPDLAVEEEVNGVTTIEFVAKKAGSFAFNCGSCESWRGMSGTLVIE